MSNKLNILQFANKPPYPPKDGGAIGMNNVTRSLLDLGHIVKLISINTSKHFVDISELPYDYKKNTAIEFHFVDTEVKPIDAFLNLFGSKSYHIQRFYNDKLAERLVDLLNAKHYDIIIMESIFLIDYLDTIRKNTKASIILRAPNVEYLIWERLANEEKNPFKKWYLKTLSGRLKKTELSSVNKFDGIFTVTDKDLMHFIENGLTIKSTFIPTGLDVEKEKMLVTKEITKQIPTVFHLGALDWMPNQEGLEWFLNKVWPMIIDKIPEAKIHIAGRRPSKELFNWQSKNTQIEGEVEDAGKFIQSHDIMIVPLFSGSGMRVKIIEGMMMGKAVVSTSIGAEGIIVKPGVDILIANTPEEFSSQIIELYKNQSKLNSLKETAVKNCKSLYSNDILAKKLEDFLISFCK